MVREDMVRFDIASHCIIALNRWLNMTKYNKIWQLIIKVAHKILYWTEYLLLEKLIIASTAIVTWNRKIK